MAEALLAGLTHAGFPPQNLIVSEPLPSRRDYLKSKFKIQTVSVNRDALSGVITSIKPSIPASIIILAVKPQHLKAVALDLAASVQHFQPLVISIVAGNIGEGVINSKLKLNLVFMERNDLGRKEGFLVKRNHLPWALTLADLVSN